MRRVLTTLFILVVFLFGAAISRAEESNPVFAFEIPEYQVLVGKTVKIKVVAQGIDGKLSHEWFSSDESVASVKNGTVNGLVGGTATIRCEATDRDGNVYSAECLVTVNIPIKSIKADVSEITLGEKPWGLYSPQDEDIVYWGYQPNITISPENASVQELEWTSSDPIVVEVSKDGYITGRRYGKATIVGTAMDGTKKSVKIRVEVPKCYVTAEEIVIDTEDGAEFGYALATIGGINSYNLKMESDYFDTESIKTASGNPLHRYRILPKKAGTGYIRVYRNGSTIATVKITVKKSAVRDVNSYPLLDISNVLQRQEESIGVKAHAIGTVSSTEIQETAENRKQISYAYVEVEGNREYFAFETISPTMLEIDKTYTVFGVIDHFEEFVTETGLRYTVPYLVNATVSK